MLPRFWLLSAFSVSSICAQAIGIQVEESAGIRRTAFPVGARVHFGQGILREPGNARLTLGDTEMPAQYSTEALWPDGTVEWLDVDWNASIGPEETQEYALEYGPDVHAAPPPRGLSVTEDADGIQVGNVRFSKSGSPLVLSVKYRGEEIGSGMNGIFMTTDAGPAKISSLKAQIVKRGPLLVVIRYSGDLIVDSTYRAPLLLTVSMPNSKTIVKISAAVKDPGRRLREIAIETPFAFGPLPWVWDFGTTRWTYGSLRNAADSVTLLQTVSGDWTVRTSQLYEKSTTERDEPVQWGHIQDGKEVVAFGVERPSQQTGTWRMDLRGDGQAAFSFAPATPSTHHEIAVFEHFVMAPVQIGAATSPSALLHPLKVTVASAPVQ